MNELPIWMQQALHPEVQKLLLDMDAAAMAATICGCAALILGLAVAARALKRGYIAATVGMLPGLAALVSWKMGWALMCWYSAIAGLLVALVCLPALHAVSKQREEAAANRRARAAKHRAQQASKRRH